jgi:stress-induced-phosphoprotein 1
MDVFKELTGIDLMDLQEKELKKKDQEEDIKKMREEEDKKRKEEDEQRRKEQEEASLPEEERIKMKTRKDAEEFKNKGNVHYKKREFDEALKYYQQAIDLLPHELTYYSNKAAVLMETKKYEDSIALIDTGIAKAKELGGIDYVKLSKAM